MELEATGLLGLLLVLLVAVLVLPRVVHSMRRSAEKIAPVLPPAHTSSAYDWDRRTHQVYRKYKGISGVNEPRAQILAFLDSHEGVEAYVEPRTVMHPLSVVLVDSEGGWRRFELAEDAFLRDLVRTRHLKVIDAMRYGYPERMRKDQGRPPAE